MEAFLDSDLNTCLDLSDHSVSNDLQKLAVHRRCHNFADLFGRKADYLGVGVGFIVALMSSY